MRKQTKFAPPISGRPPALKEKQEREPVELLRPTRENRHSLTKVGLLDNIEKHHGKILTYGWAYSFLALHNEQITTATIHSQEDLHLQIPRQFLDHSVELILGVNSRLVFNIDETRCFNWEERTNYDKVIPVELPASLIHFGVTRRIEHQTLPVCSQAAREMLYSLIVSTNRSTTRVFRDRIEEEIGLKVHIARSTYVDADLFHEDLPDVAIPSTASKRDGDRACRPLHVQLFRPHLPCCH
jgi:hypothetical protein